MVLEDKEPDDLFIHTDTIYCLLTYYPFPQLAFNIIVSVLNLIRLARQKLYYGQYKLEKKKIDFSILDTIIPLEVTKYLNSILEQNMTFPKEVFEYNFNDERFGQICLKQDFPKGPQAYLELAQWGSNWIFSNFSMANINFLISAMLLDRKVAFFSKNIRKLTSTINAFLGLLYPFKYLCPLTAILPLNNAHLFNTLPPMIIGVHRSEEYFWRRELIQYSDFIFVFIDSQTIYIDEGEDLIDMPVVDFESEELKNLFTKMNPDNLGFNTITNAMKLSTKFQSGENEYPSDKKRKKQKKTREDKEICSEIFVQFKSQLQKKILNYLPCFSDPTSNSCLKEIDEMITDEKLRSFFYAFQKTMMFSNYPESINIVERNNSIIIPQEQEAL